MNGHTHVDDSKRSYDRTFDLEKFMFDFLRVSKGNVIFVWNYGDGKKLILKK